MFRQAAKIKHNTRSFCFKIHLIWNDFQNSPQRQRDAIYAKKWRQPAFHPSNIYSVTTKTN